MATFENVSNFPPKVDSKMFQKRHKQNKPQQWMHQKAHEDTGADDCFWQITLRGYYTLNLKLVYVVLYLKIINVLLKMIYMHLYTGIYSKISKWHWNFKLLNVIL